MYRYILIFILILPQALSAQVFDDEIAFDVKGFVDSYHATGIDRGGMMMASRTRARGEFRLRRGETSAFISLNAVHNNIVSDYSGIELREAYLSYSGLMLDVTIGRQIVVWGVADALRLTDCVSPFDYTEFLARDYDDIRIPVNALRMRYLAGNTTVEFICVPVPEYFRLSTEPGNPWSIVPEGAPQIDLTSGRPARKIGNMDYGARITKNMIGADLSLSVLRTWNKIPLPGGRHGRMTMLGADCSLSAGECVVRAEAAAYLGMLGERPDESRRNVANALIGLDWYPGGDWNLSAQYCHRYSRGESNSGLATMRLSKKLLASTLDISTFAYIDVSHGGIFNRLSASYALTDQISTTLGYDYFHADGGRFEIYKKNSELWIKLRYSF